MNNHIITSAWTEILFYEHTFIRGDANTAPMEPYITMVTLYHERAGIRPPAKTVYHSFAVYPNTAFFL